MNANFFYGEVIETPSADGKRFNNTTTRNNLISVRTLNTRFSSIESGIKPLNKYNYTVPAIGEIVLLCTAPSQETDTLKTEYGTYYVTSVNIANDQNINPIPGTYWYEASNNDQTSQFNWKPGEAFEEDTVSSLQPYEGDIILSGRNGSALRFSTSYTKGVSEYSIAPPWQGKSKQPITILSTGIRSNGDVVAEDFDSTKSMIVLSSDQKLTKFKSSQSNLGSTSGVTPSSTYQGAQIVLTSDRLLFNSKKDEIILSAEKTVTVATPDWAMDMDKLFTILEGVIQQLADLTAGKAQFQTPVGGPTLTASNLAQVQQLLAEIQAMKQ